LPGPCVIRKRHAALEKQPHEPREKARRPA
jgi:hypothetical protein